MESMSSGSGSTKLSTGLAGLDGVLKGVLPGDNIVWQIGAIADYQALVTPYCEAARSAGRRLVYFRFASHPPLLLPGFGADIYELHPEDGFEKFIAAIHSAIEVAGRGAFYVFDCLSELAGDWYSDQMLGNFFMLTCPYLYDLETVTYFALYRNHHSPDATGPIADTTQVLLDVYRHEGRLFVYPIKVQHRYSSTMHMLHEWDGKENFSPVASSATTSEIRAAVKWTRGDTVCGPGLWENAFERAGELLDAGARRRSVGRSRTQLFNQLVRMIVSRDEGMLELVLRYMTIDDVVEIRKRMIGSGLIGGKTVGMLLARAMLRKAGPAISGLLESHDSFYMGSDIFYTFLVRNGIWWVFQKQKNPTTFLEGAEQARQRILTGSFPDYTMKQIEEMLDYFGQAPIIVRSSSLLEDNFGNTFAGKYESVFCGNQGSRDRRIQDFLAAVRTVYASAMSERALAYRARRGILDRDEQMALLVMRVSGSMYGRYFYPPVAGVGFSYNPYVWNEGIDPKAGVVRLVFGLGTRAVNRSDDDYTRIVALNAPDKRPESNFEEARQYSQHRVDYIDMDANQLVAGSFADVAARSENLPLAMLTEEDQSDDERPGRRRAEVLTFSGLLSNTRYVDDMRRILATLQKGYGCPVDVEFTTNFLPNGEYRINLVQCRPLPVKGEEVSRLPRVSVKDADRIIEARGAVIGQSRLVNVGCFIYVVPEAYGRLPVNERHAVARLVGRINREYKGETGDLMLIGPGRWGTTSPELGVPVSFPEINRVSILCEIVAMREDLVPDVSLGTHFLNELVEMDMLYLALFPDQKGNHLHRGFFVDAPNRLTAIVPDAAKWKDIVRVVDVGFLPSHCAVRLRADAVAQKVLCYLDRAQPR
ncbi:MAG: PEP/pyruvate-binding domain-containing protein [bacterium]